MFALGVVVGRGTSPVTFDTASFQERLRVIVGKIPTDPPEEEKVDLKFYEDLNQPVANESIQPVKPVAEVRPDTPPAVEPAAVAETPGAVPVKQSRKQASLKQKSTGLEKSGGNLPEKAKDPAAEKSQPVADKAADQPAPPSTGPASPAVDEDGKYTIQVAAYKAFKDAVSQMSVLAEKGFSSYRTRGIKDGDTWYRVRTGSFRDFQSAQAELDRLKQAKINGMIIKKDDQ